MVGLAGVLAGWPAPLRVGALLLAALLVLLPGQAALPPGESDEARFVQSSRQMIETGDVLTIRFQDEARHGSPPGIHWLQAAAASAAGGAEAPVWAYRIPGLLGAALAVALTAWAVAPLVGAQTAVLAALLLGAGLLLQAEARIARPEAALLAAVVLAQGALLRLWLNEAAPRGLAVLFWGAVGVGVLLGGAMILLPVLGALGWMAAAGRRLPPPSFRPLLGLGVLALVAGPWLLADAVLSGGASWTLSGGIPGRAAPSAPPGTHLSLAVLGFWPVAVLAPFAIAWIWQERHSRTAAFLLGWIVPGWLLFELLPAKLPHDVLFAYPALATVMAAALPAIAARPTPERWLRALLLAGWAVPAAALVLGAALAVPAIEHRIAPLAALLALVAAVPLVFAGRALWRWQVVPFATLGAAGAVLVCAALFQFALPRLDTFFVAPRLAEAADRWRCGAEGPVAVTRFHEPGAVFALGTGTVLTDGAGAGELLAEGRVPLAFVDDADMADFAVVAGARATALTRVEGYDYGRRRPVALTLYAWDRAPGSACGG